MRNPQLWGQSLTRKKLSSKVLLTGEMIEGVINTFKLRTSRYKEQMRLMIGVFLIYKEDYIASLGSIKIDLLLRNREIKQLAIWGCT